MAEERATGLWSAMKIVTPIADGTGTVTFPVLDREPVIPTIEIDGADKPAAVAEMIVRVIF